MDTSTTERTVLGAMLISKSAIDDVAAVLTGRDFADPRHEAIHDAISHLANEGTTVDAIAVANHLGDDLRRIGGQTYLHECIALVATPESAGYHAAAVRAASMLRKVAEVGTKVAALGAIESRDTDYVLEVVNAARGELDALTDAQDDDVPHEQAIYDAIDSLDRPVGIKTPWRALSSAISGWSPGWLYIVGARPGVGKSVAGIACAIDAAQRGRCAVLFSLEMPKNDLYLRMLSAVGAIDGERILHRALDLSEEAEMAEAAAVLAGLPIVVDDRSAVSLAQIRAKVRRVQRSREVGIVVVDYLGLVKPPPDAPRNDRRVQVDAIAQGLKNLARDLQVPIVALSQLNRSIESRAEKMPTTADLRESGGIEAAADVVMLMHRARGAEVGDESDLMITLAKNRHGPMITFHLDFQGQYSRAVDRDLARWSA